MLSGHWQSPPSVYDCVCEWVNLASIVKFFKYWKKRYINASQFKENIPLRMFSRTLGHNVQAMLLLNILMKQNIFRIFLENVNLEHSGTF